MPHVRQFPRNQVADAHRRHAGELADWPVAHWGQRLRREGAL